MVDWTAALSGVSTAIQIAKDLRALDSSMNEAVHKAQLVGLMEQLSEVKMQMLEAREGTRELEGKVRSLEEFSADLGQLANVQGFYFDKFEDGSPRGEPYCRYCIERKTGLFHTHSVDYRQADYVCPNCNTKYTFPPSYPWEQG